jgi:molecular chaperone GrpE
MNEHDTPTDELDLQSEQTQDATADFDAAHSSSEPLTRDEQMEALRRETDEANKRVLLAQAESENFRKRMRRDFEDQIKYAAMPIVNDILQVRDNLQRALSAAGSAGEGLSLSEGVAMVVKQLDIALAKHGVTPIDNSGAFDPNVHEAISQMPSPDHEAGMIAHVAATGFLMHDRVVRPSQVVVSTGAG